jgi:hypothetical protein
VTWQKGSVKCWWKKKVCVPTKNNIPEQASKILPAISSFYEENSSVYLGDILREKIKQVQFTATNALMSILVVDKMWHSDGV